MASESRLHVTHLATGCLHLETVVPLPRVPLKSRTGEEQNRVPLLGGNRGCRPGPPAVLGCQARSAQRHRPPGTAGSCFLLAAPSLPLDWKWVTRANTPCFLDNCCFSFFCSSGLLSRPVEAPRLGVQSELQPPAYTTATAMRDPSRVCDLHHNSGQRRILNPLGEARDRTHVLMDPTWANC